MSMDVTWRLGIDAALGLANSLHGPGAHYRRRARPEEPPHDHLVDATDAHAFLSTHAIPVPTAPPTAGQLKRLRVIRALARGLAAASAEAGDTPGSIDEWRADIGSALATVDYRLRPDGSMGSAASGWDGVADDLLPAVLALAEVRDRIRTCGNPLCRWLFVDRSRNGSRVWCEMAVCGNRMKVGRHRSAVSRPGTPSGPPG
jgi:predicted RNA-binding Zn ribbon-like protein